MEEKIDILKVLEYESSDEALRQFIVSSHPYDIAEIFAELSEKTKQRLYQILTAEELASIFSYIDEVDAARHLEDMDIEKSSSILSEMDIDDVVDIVNELDEPERIVALLEDDIKDEIDDLSIHKNNTAGSIMTTNYLEIQPDMDVKEAMKQVVNFASDSEVIDPLFVCLDGVLVGILELKELIIARSPKKISEIMETNFISCPVDKDIEEANKIISNYGLYALPVLEKNILRGIITIDDAFNSIQESVSEDYSQMAAINGIEDHDSLAKMYIKRLPWLAALLVLSFVASNLLQLFEDVIQEVTILVFFQTMLLDMAGNLGTQSLAVTIQKMTDDELDTKKQELRHLFREIRISALNSFLLALVAFSVVCLFLLFSYHGEHSRTSIALVISLSLFMTLLISGTISTLFPILLRKIKVDPAVASGPFIVTINDIVSIIIYFNLAILILGLVM